MAAGKTKSGSSGIFWMKSGNLNLLLLNYTGILVLYIVVHVFFGVRGTNGVSKTVFTSRCWDHVVTSEEVVCEQVS